MRTKVTSFSNSDWLAVWLRHDSGSFAHPQINKEPIKNGCSGDREGGQNWWGGVQTRPRHLPSPLSGGVEWLVDYTWDVLNIQQWGGTSSQWSAWWVLSALSVCFCWLIGGMFYLGGCFHLFSLTLEVLVTWLFPKIILGLQATGFTGALFSEWIQSCINRFGP